MSSFFLYVFIHWIIKLVWVIAPISHVGIDQFIGVNTREPPTARGVSGATVNVCHGD